MPPVLKPRIHGLVRWHKRFAGIYARVAKKLALSPSYVNRVAQGERESPAVLRALEAELRRLEKLRPK